ncbi:acyl-CoA N-acyltransferase [Byssothecium circinans]|uniref:N-alpha-acetyltransferase 40 n=1 Tax=Byssothecium circinans TaxID=147558 RepID=A0A6A5TNP7_9PLEO|nr:acyl-CoA N-acyltransferase [Byssothecium circinans]
MKDPPRQEDWDDDALHLSPTDLEACLNIVKYTSYDDYKRSSTGWNERKKKEEMADPEMTYLLIRADSTSHETFAPTLDTDILAFTSFKFEFDDPPYTSRPVIYIYEVHVGEKLRGRGLAKYMVWCIEAMADTRGISKTMLTVYVSNEAAIKAYKRLGYTRDEASPPDRKMRGRVIKADYMIMSKFWGEAGDAKG